MADQFVQHEHIIINSVETVHMMSDPMRIRIAEVLSEPRSVKEVAAIFNVPVTRLYYHINLMEEHGIIQVVDTQIISGLVEKKYQLIAKNFSIDDDIFSSDPKVGRRVDEMVGAIFENVRRQLRLLISTREMQRDEDGTKADDRIKLNYNLVALTPDELESFDAEIEKLIERYAPDRAERSPDAQVYGFTVALYPNIEAEEINSIGNK